MTDTMNSQTGTMNNQTGAIAPVFILNEETFTKKWLANFPVMPYDPDQQPKRFKYDADLIIYEMRLEHERELSAYHESQRILSKDDSVGIEPESPPLEPSTDTE